MARYSIVDFRDAILESRYEMSEHAIEEMEDDSLDVLDIESAILTGIITKVLSDDPRGVRYVIRGNACDGQTLVEVVMRWIVDDHVLIITVYEI